MAHPRRGRRSGTYEIQEIVAVDFDELTITYRHTGAFQPAVARLSVEPTTVARQLLQAMADSIKVGNNGDAASGWESSQTVRNALSYCKVILRELENHGFDTFADERLDVGSLRALYQPLTSNMRRSACWLLARVIRDNHPNGTALAAALKNTRFAVDESSPFRYDEPVSAAIEKAARAVYRKRYEAQRELLQRLGHDVDGRDWLRIPAEQLISWARTSHPSYCEPNAPQPLFGATYDQQMAWALTHPAMFGYRRFARGPLATGARLQQIGIALYPDNVTLTAAAILHCLGDNSGYNLSVLLEKSADSLVFLGSDEALEHNVKARNKTQDTRVTRRSPLYSAGGIVEGLCGLTRFSRFHRGHLVDPNGTPSVIVSRLYVEHTADPSDARVLDSQRMISAWRSNREFDADWDSSAGERSEVPLRMSALRLVALARALNEGIHADVHGHSERTKVHYTAHVLPDHVFNKHAVAAQDSFHDDAVAKFQVVADATDGLAGELAAIDPAEVMDVEVGLCTSGGSDPDQPDRRCSLGIVACFTCPNGYRTVDHVPGLLAAVELGNIIERNDPTEWEQGQAAPLRFYARECLNQFPRLVVENVRRNTNLRPHILTVTGMYMEMRHG